MKKRSQPKSLYKKEDDDFSFSRFLNTELSFKQLVIIFSVAFLVMFLILKNNMMYSVVEEVYIKYLYDYAISPCYVYGLLRELFETEIVESNYETFLYE